MRNLSWTASDTGSLRCYEGMPSTVNWRATAHKTYDSDAYIVQLWCKTGWHKALELPADTPLEDVKRAVETLLILHMDDGSNDASTSRQL